MKYFKDNNNNVFAYDSNGSQDSLIEGKAQISEAEAIEISKYIQTQEELISIDNAAARRYLSDTDWYVIRQIETGVAIPLDITRLREEARLKVV